MGSRIQCPDSRSRMNSSCLIIIFSSSSSLCLCKLPAVSGYDERPGRSLGELLSFAPLLLRADQ